MATKTFYVKNENLQLFKKAEEISNKSLSDVIVEAIKNYIQEKEVYNQGLDKISLDVGTVYENTYDIDKVWFYGKYLTGNEEIDKNNKYRSYDIYKTKKGKFVVFEHISEIGKNNEVYKYKVHSSIDEIKAEYDFSNEFINDILKEYNNSKVEFLDI